MQPFRFALGFAFLALTALPAFALDLGAKMPSGDVKMKNVDGKELALNDLEGSKGRLVIFSCNHCPYAKQWESRIVEIGNSYSKRGIAVAVVNSNDPSRNREDGFDEMQKRAKEKNYQFPYLVDATSDLARAFDASRTPEVFLFDANGALVYTGAVDDNSDSAAKVKEPYLLAALDSLLEGKPVAKGSTKSIGCGIKFRPPQAKSAKPTSSGS
jgi:hypothetical protein